jgi:hypothetical protein
MLRFLSLMAAAVSAWAAAQAHAETFKWVDERGVVNYSNRPSAAKSSPSTVVEDRISTYQSPPLPAVAIHRAPDYEWLQRQQIMAQRAASKTVPADCGDRVDCREGYWPAYGYPFVPIVARPRAHRLLRTSRTSR